MEELRDVLPEGQDFENLQRAFEWWPRARFAPFLLGEAFERHCPGDAHGIAHVPDGQQPKEFNPPLIKLQQVHGALWAAKCPECGELLWTKKLAFWCRRCHGYGRWVGFRDEAFLITEGEGRSRQVDSKWQYLGIGFTSKACEVCGSSIDSPFQPPPR